MTYYANTKEPSEDPKNQTARLVYAPIDDIDKKTFIDLQTTGDMVGGKAIDMVYDTILMQKDDDTIYVMWTARTAEGNYYRFYCPFVLSTKTLGKIGVNRFKVGNTVNDFSVSGIKSALAENGIPCKKMYSDIGIMQKLSSRVENGETYYFSGTYSGDFTCVIKSKDLITWEYVSQPDFINDSKWENATYVLNDKVYYLGTDSKLYAMGIDGQNRELVSDKVSDYLAITKEYIIHDVKREDSADKETHIMKIDGSDDKAVIEKTKLNTVAVVEDYIYYTTGDKEIFRTKIGSGEAELVYDIAAYNFNVSNDGYIYFFGYEDVEAKKYTICLFRVKTDGTSEKAELLYKLADNSDYLNVVNGQAFFMDEEGSKSFIRNMNSGSCSLS